MGKAGGAALILAGVAVLIGAYLLPHQGAGPIDHEPRPMTGVNVNAPSGSIASGHLALWT